MTPAARLSAGIEILDAINGGIPAEKVLTNWARNNRYAGSTDRAAIRDLVFDILRKRRSSAAAGGGETGRALVIGHLRLRGENPGDWFTGEKFAPDALSTAETAHISTPYDWPIATQLDVPEWLLNDLKASLDADFAPIMNRLRDRADVFLRVNPRKSSLETAMKSLARDQIMAEPFPLAPFALIVRQNPRRIAASQAFLNGSVELQDAASQAVIAELDLPPTGRILDYCAGGGGKTLAMAATTDAALFAHDAMPARMRDLPIRAKRASVKVTCVDQTALARHAPFDLVLCDAPCSGSGAWRRSPAAKWDLTRERLDNLLSLQQKILTDAAQLVAPGGVLAYATCSLLDAENADQAAGFLANHPEFSNLNSRIFTPLDGADGLYVTAFKRD